MTRRARSRRRPVDVRMFPGWAESVLWLDGSGPLDYEGLGLPASLVRDLQTWDLAWSRAARPGQSRGPTWRERRQHDREGRRLAPLVAAAFGDDLVVELGLSRRWLGRRRYRGQGPASAPVAAAAVRTRQAEVDARRARLTARPADGAGLEWRAYPPGADPTD